MIVRIYNPMHVLTPKGTGITKTSVEYSQMGLWWIVILDENGKEWDFKDKDVHFPRSDNRKDY